MKEEHELIAIGREASGLAARFGRRLMGVGWAWLVAAYVPFASAQLPAGGSVTAGDAAIESAGQNMTIRQSSDRAIIRWDDFSIGSGHAVSFLQPSGAAATLNRVTGGHPSEILGTLTANGRIYLINPSGILVGAGVRIDTASFVASTLDLADGEFLAGGDMTFRGDSEAAIMNLGRISAFGGDVILIARRVENYGTITARADADGNGGLVGLASGGEVLVKAAGDERIFIKPSSHSVHSIHSVENSGQIEAVEAELKAQGNPYGLAIHNGGLIRTTGVERRNGRVLLVAREGTVVHEGVIEARNDEGRGGEVILDSLSVNGRTVFARGAMIDVDGGGGFAEVSSRGVVELGGKVLAGGGRVLLDPPRIHIQNMPGPEAGVTYLTPAMVDLMGAGTWDVVLEADDEIRISGVDWMADYGLWLRTGGRIEVVDSELRVTGSCVLEASGIEILDSYLGPSPGWSGEYQLDAGGGELVMRDSRVDANQIALSGGTILLEDVVMNSLMNEFSGTITIQAGQRVEMWDSRIEEPGYFGLEAPEILWVGSGYRGTSWTATGLLVQTERAVFLDGWTEGAAYGVGGQELVRAGEYVVFDGMDLNFFDATIQGVRGPAIVDGVVHVNSYLDAANALVQSYWDAAIPSDFAAEKVRVNTDVLARFGIDLGWGAPEPPPPPPMELEPVAGGNLAGTLGVVNADEKPAGVPDLFGRFTSRAEGNGVPAAMQMASSGGGKMDFSALAQQAAPVAGNFYEGQEAVDKLHESAGEMRHVEAQWREANRKATEAVRKCEEMIRHVVQKELAHVQDALEMARAIEKAREVLRSRPPGTVVSVTVRQSNGSVRLLKGNLDDFGKCLIALENQVVPALKERMESVGVHWKDDFANCNIFGRGYGVSARLSLVELLEGNVGYAQKAIAPGLPGVSRHASRLQDQWKAWNHYNDLAIRANFSANAAKGHAMRLDNAAGKLAVRLGETGQARYYDDGKAEMEGPPEDYAEGGFLMGAAGGAFALNIGMEVDGASFSPGMTFDEPAPASPPVHAPAREAGNGTTAERPASAGVGTREEPGWFESLFDVQAAHEYNLALMERGFQQGGLTGAFQVAAGGLMSTLTGIAGVGDLVMDWGAAQSVAGEQRGGKLGFIQATAGTVIGMGGSLFSTENLVTSALTGLSLVGLGAAFRLASSGRILGGLGQSAARLAGYAGEVYGAGVGVGDAQAAWSGRAAGRELSVGERYQRAAFAVAAAAGVAALIIGGTQVSGRLARAGANAPDIRPAQVAQSAESAAFRGAVELSPELKALAEAPEELLGQAAYNAKLRASLEGRSTITLDDVRTEMKALTQPVRPAIPAVGTPARTVAIARGKLVVSKDVGITGSKLEFSGAALVQGELKASALLKSDLSTPIYRLAGGDAPVMGKSWTTLDPRVFQNISAFKQAAGIGPWNTGETLVIGRLKKVDGAVGRTALPHEGNPDPWVPEIRLNEPTEQMVDILQIVLIK